VEKIVRRPSDHERFQTERGERNDNEKDGGRDRRRKGQTDRGRDGGREGVRTVAPGASHRNPSKAAIVLKSIECDMSDSFGSLP